MTKHVFRVMLQTSKATGVTLTTDLNIGQPLESGRKLEAGTATFLGEIALDGPDHFDALNPDFLRYLREIEGEDGNALASSLEMQTSYRLRAFTLRQAGLKVRIW